MDVVTLTPFAFDLPDGETVLEVESLALRSDEDGGPLLVTEVAPHLLAALARQDIFSLGPPRGPEDMLSKFDPTQLVRLELRPTESFVAGLGVEAGDLMGLGAALGQAATAETAGFLAIKAMQDIVPGKLSVGVELG